MYKNNKVLAFRIISGGFNPCFNGTMYKNLYASEDIILSGRVSILVLMELCIKTLQCSIHGEYFRTGFNPCFNGTMYKNPCHQVGVLPHYDGFNPCFNGTMYKNSAILLLNNQEFRFQSLF